MEAKHVWLESLACSATGHILFDRWDGTRGIWAFPFSLEKLTATGEMHRVSDVGYTPSVANDGTLLCGVGEQDDAFSLKRLVWVDRAGAVQSTVSRALPGFAGIRLSPDGQRAVGMAGETVESLDIWIFDLSSGQLTANALAMRFSSENLLAAK